MTPGRKGRPRLILDPSHLFALRESGLSLREIARKVGAGKDTVRKALAYLSNKPVVERSG